MNKIVVDRENDYAAKLGAWVTMRCLRRALIAGADASKKMPEEIKLWLDTGGKSPADGDTPPPSDPDVVDWLDRTVRDPDWPDA